MSDRPSEVYEFGAFRLDQTADDLESVRVTWRATDWNEHPLKIRYLFSHDVNFLNSPLAQQANMEL